MTLATDVFELNKYVMILSCVFPCQICVVYLFCFGGKGDRVPHGVPRDIDGPFWNHWGVPMGPHKDFIGLSGIPCGPMGAQIGALSGGDRKKCGKAVWLGMKKYNLAAV